MDSFSLPSSESHPPPFSSSSPSSSSIPFPSSSSSSFSSSRLTADEARALDAAFMRWLVDTRYQMTAEEKRPFIRNSNLALTGGICVGVLTNLGWKRAFRGAPVLPAWLPAWLAGIYTANVLVRVWKPWFYQKELELDTPGGAKAREILHCIRNGMPTPRSSPVAPGGGSTSLTPPVIPPPLLSSSASSCVPVTTSSDLNKESFDIPSSPSLMSFSPPPTTSSEDVDPGRRPEEILQEDTEWLEFDSGNQRKATERKSTGKEENKFKTWDDVRREAGKNVWT